MDATTVQITTKAYLAEVRQRLDEAASITKAAQACAAAGNIEKGYRLRSTSSNRCTRSIRF
jgi:hypothetical protein